MKVWPTFKKLYSNGVNDKYSTGALIQLEDCDVGENKWFVSTIVGNITFDTLENIFCDRMIDAIGLVMSVTSELIQEVMSKKPSILKEGLKSFAKGCLESLYLFGTYYQNK